jgi:hypothetical protein
MRIRIWPWASTLIVVGCAACSASDPASTQHPVGALDKSVPSIADGAASGSGVGASAVAGTAAVSVGASGTSAPSIAGGPAKPPLSTPSAIAGIGGGNPVPAAGAVAPPPAATGGAVASEPATPHDTKTCLKAGPGSYAEPGPYKVAMMDVDLGMIEASQHTGKFTIFYPMPLETSCLHPIVAWGNGTTVKDSTTYAFFNSNAASWGMVVIASQEDNAGSGNFHKAGIDYLLKQNGDASSMFYKKLSTRAGVAGHSQGGFGANAGSQHPNVEALVSVAGGGVPKAKVATLCLTGTKDMVEAGCTAQYNAATGPAFLADWMDGDHFTTETLAGYITRDPGSLQMQRLLAAWFRCFLADDQDACALFKGAPSNCGICKDTGWAKHESHNL